MVTAKKEVLKKEAIKTGAHAVDWQDAVRQAGRLLVEAGIAEEQYIDAMIEMVKEYGPYILVAPGIAMPHSHAYNGVKDNGISFLKLDEPVIFPGREDNGITLVIALAALDNSSHMSVMSGVACTLLDDDERLYIMGLEDADEIYRVMNRES